MRSMSKAAPTLLAALLVIATPALAAADDAQFVQEMRDRVKIEQLMWDYVRAIDSFNADAYAKTFTPDGAFNSVTGSEALKKMVTDLKTDQDARRAKGEQIPPMHHMMSNQTIEFVSPDHARVHYYWQTVFAGKSRIPPPRLAAAGRGVDDVVRVNGAWLIRHRNVAPEN